MSEILKGFLTDDPRDNNWNGEEIQVEFSLNGTKYIEPADVNSGCQLTRGDGVDIEVKMTAMSCEEPLFSETGAVTGFNIIEGLEPIIIGVINNFVCSDCPVQCEAYKYMRDK